MEKITSRCRKLRGKTLAKTPNNLKHLLTFLQEALKLVSMSRFILCTARKMPIARRTLRDENMNCNFLDRQGEYFANLIITMIFFFSVNYYNNGIVIGITVTIIIYNKFSASDRKK